MHLHLCAFHDFQAHAGVVVGTFPETGLVIDGIEGAVGMTAPMPLTVVPIDDLGLDVVPTA